MTSDTLAARGARVKALAHYRQQLRWWKDRPLMAEPIKSEAIHQLAKLIKDLEISDD